MSSRLRFLLSFLLVLAGLQVFAADKIYPDRPNPPRLVNDLAHMMSGGEVSQLESLLEEFARTSSTQITIVTIKNLGGYEISSYSVEVFNRWGIGQQGKNNGVLLLVSLDDRKAWITVGKGLEGVLTDVKAGIIFRNELRPAFKEGQYYKGLSDAATAIIAVTKNEYKAEGLHEKKPMPLFAIIIIVIFVAFILKMFRGGGGGGGGNYMSGRGFNNVATGILLGQLLGGGGRSGGGGFGGGGGGGFGGFGGGSSGGGGAGGSW